MDNYNARGRAHTSRGSLASSSLCWPAKEPLKTALIFIVRAATVLAAFTHSGHIVHYAPVNSLSCRLVSPRTLRLFQLRTAVFKGFLLLSLPSPLGERSGWGEQRSPTFTTHYVATTST
ncbi:hypothetical protein DXF93_04895 [Escherichia coli]|nr:hypothetical protein DXF93_04895 [Escherichia coli]